MKDFQRSYRSTWHWTKEWGATEYRWSRNLRGWRGTGSCGGSRSRSSGSSRSRGSGGTTDRLTNAASRSYIDVEHAKYHRKNVETYTRLGSQRPHSAFRHQCCQRYWNQCFGLHKKQVWAERGKLEGATSTRGNVHGPSEAGTVSRRQGLRIGGRRTRVVNTGKMFKVHYTHGKIGEYTSIMKKRNVKL